MSFSQYYGNIIWTNHALQRLKNRGLSQQDAYKTFKNPDRKTVGKQLGTTEFQKEMYSSEITVIAKKNERNQWLILSAWVEPPIPGSIDAKRKEEYEKYKKMGFWEKTLFVLKRQLGL